MATSTAIGYNTGSTISGTQKIGNLAVVISNTVNPSLDPGGVKFWMGPDESLGYCIGIPVPSGTQSTPIVGLSAFLGFIRSSALTESSFVEMTNSTFGQSFTGGTQCKTYLNNNGYWTSYAQIPYIYGSPTLVFDFSNTSSYVNANTGTSVADLSGLGNNGIFSTGTGNGTPATVTGYNTTGYLNLPGTSNQRSVRLPDGLKPTGTVSFTYIVNIRPKGYSYNGDFPGILSNGSDASGNGFTLGYSSTFGGPYATRGVSNSNIVQLPYTGGSGLNTWFVSAVKFNGVSTTLYEYYDNVLYSANTVGATSVVSSVSWGFFLGLRYNQWFNGDINYTAMYNTVLTDSEILTISQTLAARTINLT